MSDAFQRWMAPFVEEDMGRINSRTKGRAFEQDIARTLREELGVEVTRNWQEQAAHGGTDLVGVEGWAIECKRAKKYSPQWWKQTVEQADKCGELPVLVYKLDYQPITVELSAKYHIPELADEGYRISMPFEAWICMIRENMDEV